MDYPMKRASKIKENYWNEMWFKIVKYNFKGQSKPGERSGRQELVMGKIEKWLLRLAILKF